MEYSPYVVNASNMYQYDGLYMHTLACKYDTFTGNDIWVNFKYKLISINLNGSGGLNVFLPYSKNIGSYIIDENIHTDSTTKYDDWPVNPMIEWTDSGFNYRNAPLNAKGSIGVSMASYYNSGEIYNFHDYSVHIVDNTFTYYIDGNLIGSVSGTNYKMFCIGFSYGSYAGSAHESNHSIQSITLTDQMSTEIPRPPYTLDEKNNEIYGYKK